MRGPVRHTPIIALTAGAHAARTASAAWPRAWTTTSRSRCRPEQLEAVLRRWVPEAGAARASRSRAGVGGARQGPVDWDVLADLLALTRAEFLQELLVLFLRDSRRLTDLRIAWREDDRAACGAGRPQAARQLRDRRRARA